LTDVPAHTTLTSMDEPDDRTLDLSPKEAARARRRDRERTAQERELMRSGQAKAFKQILDAQARRAADVEARAAGTTAAGGGKARPRSAAPDGNPTSPSR
jgi:hypothetical protein